jgi:hypothetical protein
MKYLDDYYTDPRRDADSCAVAQVCFIGLAACAIFGILGFLAGLFL